MRTWKNMVAALGCIGVGTIATSALGASADAQEQQFTEAQAWEVYHGAYMSAVSDDRRFYVVRHNRITGETQYIGCEDRDGCTQLHVEVQEP